MINVNFDRGGVRHIQRGTYNSIQNQTNAKTIISNGQLKISLSGFKNADKMVAVLYATNHTATDNGYQYIGKIPTFISLDKDTLIIMPSYYQYIGNTTRYSVDGFRYEVYEFY